MGSTRCKGVRYSILYNYIKLPQTPRLEIITRIIQVTTMWYTRYKQVKIYKKYRLHPRAKHAPSGFHPTWTAFTGNLITQALKDWISVASPSGILNHLPVHTTTMINWSTRYSVKHKPINHITMKTYTSSCNVRDKSNKIITSMCYLSITSISPQTYKGDLCN